MRTSESKAEIIIRRKVLVLVNHCSVLLQMMCGKIKKANPNYFLTSTRIKENASCILTDWIYIFPQNFLAIEITDLKETLEVIISLDIKD